MKSYDELSEESFTGIKRCRNCSFYQGDGVLSSQILCKSKAKAEEYDSYLSNDNYTVEFKQEGDISILPPSFSGEVCLCYKEKKKWK